MVGVNATAEKLAPREPFCCLAIKMSVIRWSQQQRKRVQVWHGGIELFNFNALMTRNSVDAGIC